MTPEEKARQEIDKILQEAGWIVQDRSELNIRVSFGVAVREFIMKDNGESDYLLFVNGKAIDIFKAKNIQQIKKFLAKPIPLCKYCEGSNVVTIGKWGISKKDIAEWIGHP